MKLSKRLQAIESMIEPCGTLVDVGCDHGLLSIAIAQNKLAKQVIASDVRTGPLSRAKEAIKQSDVASCITCVLSDGLQAITVQPDCIVVAGMGFETIRGIMRNDINKFQRAKQVLLSSHTQLYELRSFLSDQGFSLINEKIVFDRHYYEILSVVYTNDAQLSEDEKLFGKQNQQDPLFKDLCLHKLEKAKLVLQQIPTTHVEYQKLQQDVDVLLSKVNENGAK